MYLKYSGVTHHKGVATGSSYALDKGEVQCQTLNREDAVEQVLMDKEEKQKEAENELAQEKEETQEDDNGQTPDTLQAPQVEEKELSLTDGRFLDKNAEEAQIELGEAKTDQQTKKLKEENRRLCKILKQLIEERGKQFDEEFEPLTKQDALCQKNYEKCKETEQENGGSN
jgi:hypothetical protein